MFVSQSNETGKMKFHKPNILRKKPKISATTVGNETLDTNLVKPVVSNNIIKLEYALDNSLVSSETPSPVLTQITREIEDTIDEGNQNKDFSTENLFIDSGCIDHSDNVCEKPNIFCSPAVGDAFLEDDIIHYTTEPMELFQISLCVDLMPTIDSSVSEMNQVPEVTSLTDPIMFKCDFGDCAKSFPTKQKLKKHIARHNKAKPLKNIKHLLQCPAYVPKSEVPCKRIFELREELVKHLNSEHSTEDGMHRCDSCGRRFFTLSGWRVHRRACGAAGAGAARRAPLLCPWEGCGRVFLQPCRLKEHSRAHTGDRPYPCMHPGCGWSFRTASKLMRHARRHTGERRHACPSCPKHFRRREHLRMHLLRHAPPAVQALQAGDASIVPPPPPGRRLKPRHCTHIGCAEVFKDVKSLSAHMKSAHGVKPSGERKQGAPRPPAWLPTEPFVVHSLLSECELRAARTHCPWPLSAPAPAPATACAAQVSREHDIQIELSEGSESNASTIRSDLFLHGNILPQEDHESIREVALCAEPYPGHVTPLNADISPLDPPTLDLMQEELMYTDSAVDESSFQVLLLSDVDLN